MANCWTKEVQSALCIGLAAACIPLAFFVTFFLISITPPYQTHICKVTSCVNDTVTVETFVNADYLVTSYQVPCDYIGQNRTQLLCYIIPCTENDQQDPVVCKSERLFVVEPTNLKRDSSFMWLAWMFLSFAICIMIGTVVVMIVYMKIAAANYNIF